MSKTEAFYDRIDHRLGFKREEKKNKATQNLARVLGIDHGDRATYVNLTREPCWMSMR